MQSAPQVYATGIGLVKNGVATTHLMGYLAGGFTFACRCCDSSAPET